MELEVYAIPNFYWGQACGLVGRAPVLVDWEYEVLAGCGSFQDLGFVPSRDGGYPGFAHRSAEERRAGLFRLHGLSDLVSLRQATTGDVSGEVTIFGVRPGRHPELVSFLRSPERPQLEDFLEAGEVFIDLVVGEDLGHDDCLTIKSLGDRDGEIRELEAKYGAAIASFEGVAPGIRSEPEAITSLERLASGELQG